MYILFSSETPAVVKLNGAILGQISTLKFCDIDLTVPPLIEVVFLSTNKIFSFYPTTDFFNKSSNQYIITDLNSGYHIHFLSVQSEYAFKLISQQKFETETATLFIQDGYHFTIETNTEFYNEDYFLNIESAKIEEHEFNQEKLLFLETTGSEKTLSIYLLNPIKKVFQQEITEFSAINDITVKKCYKDIMHHEIEYHYSLLNDELIETKKEITAKKEFISLNLTDSILPYAFLENLKVGDSITEFLGEEILKNAEKLSTFFGDFVGVCPPPFFLEQSFVALIKPNGLNKFKLEYYSFTVIDKKITAINKL